MQKKTGKIQNAHLDMQTSLVSEPANWIWNKKEGPPE